MLKKIGIGLIILIFTLPVKGNLTAPDILPSKANVPVSFRENKGQICNQNYKARPDVLFSGTDGQLVFHLRSNGISYQLNRVDAWEKENAHGPLTTGHTERMVPGQMSIYRIDVNWLNANTDASIKKEQPLQGYDNFYSESCPNGALFVKSYAQIVYQQLYAGIDLKWYCKDGHLKYDYIIAAGADYSQVQLELKGAKKISINKNGALVIKTPLGELVEQAPLVMQNSRQLQASWVLRHNVVSFQIDNVDPHYPLIIDPLIRFWGTYYGGSSYDDLYYSSIDPNGNIYVCGDTRSTNLQSIATTGAYQSSFGGLGSGVIPGDAVLVKFNAAGQRLWGTYYGGTGADFANGCDADASGNIYMVGVSNSTNVIASPGSHQPVYGGGPLYGDAFIVKFDNAGLRIWGTYYGSSGWELALGCCVDLAGNIYMSAVTTSTIDIASPGSHQPVYGGNEDACLVKFNPAGVRLWCTYYGGSGFDGGYGCNTDLAGNVYLTGHTASTQAGVIATPGCQQPVIGSSVGSYGDGFIAKFDQAGVRQWGTYYGGSFDDYLYNCEPDAGGNIYASGMTASSNNISTVGSHQPAYGGGSSDVFLVRFDASGNRLWGTYYGGTGTEDYGYTSIDNAGHAYLAGQTSSAGGTVIATACTYQDSYGGGIDAFLVKFDASGNRSWGTYYGGSGAETWATVTVDPNGNNIYLTGVTASTAGSVIATPGSHQAAYAGGGTDGFFVKFDNCNSASAPNTTPPADLNVCYGNSTTLTTSVTCGISWFTSPSGGSPVFTNASFYITPPLTTNTTFYIEASSCGMAAPRTAVNVTVLPAPAVFASANPAVICAGESATLNAAGAGSYTWASSGIPLSIADASIVAAPVATSTYTVTGSNGTCEDNALVTLQVVPKPEPVISTLSGYVCRGSSVSLNASGAQAYSWQPANLFSGNNTGSSVMAMPVSSTIFTVTGTNVSGTVSCTRQGTLAINLLDHIPAYASGNAVICEGGNALLSASGGGNNFSWAPAAGIKDPNNPVVVVSPSVTTLYSVTVSENNTCGGLATVMVVVNPRPSVFAGHDTVFNLKEPMFISATSSGRITWIDGDGISCITCASTQIFPTHKSCYTAQATSDAGCTSIDEVCIDVGTEHVIYIPNSFTPNNDGLNDFFIIEGFGISDVVLSIYDRWGEKLFVSKDPAFGWNGIYKGAACKAGTYVYTVEYTYAHGRRQLDTGHVNLIR